MNINKNNNSNNNPEYPNPATVWGLYHLLPDCIFFRIDVFSESDNRVVESLTFMKNDDKQRKDGEKQMYSLLGKYIAYGYRRINFEWRWGLGTDATVQIVVD